MQFEPQRQQVVDLCLLLSQRGYFAGTGGNLMLRIDADTVAVTPSATDYLAMNAADVSVLRLRDLAVIEGARAPSVETSLHARVLRARPDVGCSIHTHQPVASACALRGRALVVPARWQPSLGSRVPLVGYAPSGSGWLARKLAGALRPDLNAYLMRNHGILCCGRDIAAAVQAVDDLEALAHQHLAGRMAERIAAHAAAHGDPWLRRVHDALLQRPAGPSPDSPFPTPPAPARPLA